VDGGRPQKLVHYLRRSDAWNVAQEISFARVVEIEVIEHHRDIFKKDRKIGQTVPIRSGSIADGQAEAYSLRRPDGAHYWISFGSGNYVPLTPPPPDPPREPPEEDGGTYTTPESASAAGQQLVREGLATRFRVIPGVDIVTSTRIWFLKYVPKPKD
jgi:hypothetical protein